MASMKPGGDERHGDLLPCPFCGGRAVLRNASPLAFVMCESCKASTALYTFKCEAIENWQRRATDDER